MNTAQRTVQAILSLAITGLVGCECPIPASSCGDGCNKVLGARVDSSAECRTRPIVGCSDPDSGQTDDWRCVQSATDASLFFLGSGTHAGPLTASGQFVDCDVELGQQVSQLPMCE